MSIRVEGEAEINASRARICWMLITLVDLKEEEEAGQETFPRKKLKISRIRQKSSSRYFGIQNHMILKRNRSSNQLVKT